jgi:hypothetical protein
METATHQRAKMSGMVPTRDQILTQSDLLEFKEDILQEFKRIIKECVSGQPGKKWLKLSKNNNGKMEVGMMLIMPTARYQFGVL